jgi:GGDEF domain-containing protein
VVRLREHLRGGDLVGRLSAGDVGVLLQDASAAQAGFAVARLRRLLERDGVSLVQVALGTASRNPGDAVPGALAEEARENARRDAGRN